MVSTCRAFGVVVATLAAVLGLPAAGAAGSMVSPVVRPAYDWSMPERFGGDADRDGLIDLPNTVEYVHNRAPGSCPTGCGEALFHVVLDASASRATAAGEPLGIVSYRWGVHLEGADGALEYARTTPRLALLLPEGNHRVALTVTARLPWGTTSARVSGPLVVDDLLIVALGDSYASGEGNPEIPRSPGTEAGWGDGVGDPLVENAHARAHRSTLAWPAQTALLVERADPRTSVTFITLADSGASVDDGLVATRSGAPGQIEEAAALVAEREVDAVLLSIGGNDVGFSNLVRGLVDADRLFDPICYEVDLANVWAAVDDGDWNRGSAVDYRLDRPWQLGCRAVARGDQPRLPGMAGLPAALDRAGDALTVSLAPGAVYISEYPDPSGTQRDGHPGCGEIVGDTTPPFRFHEIDRDEQEEGRRRVLDPLNAAVRAAAERHGWVYLDGVAEAFSNGHGYCADWPVYDAADERPPPHGAWSSRLDHPERWYRNPGVAGPVALPADPTTSWYRSAAQSAVLQGPDARYATAGTLHPNELGHRAIAELALAALRDR